MRALRCLCSVTFGGLVLASSLLVVGACGDFSPEVGPLAHPKAACATTGQADAGCGSDASNSSYESYP